MCLFFLNLLYDSFPPTHPSVSSSRSFPHAVLRTTGARWVFGSDGELCESGGVPALWGLGSGCAELPRPHCSLLQLDFQC